RLDGISDIRDESDRDGMRIVIELKRDAYPRVVLNNLYKQTPLQSNFGANMLALVNGEPQLLTLSQFLNVFLDFRIETITRRTQYELRKAEERDHLLQGLLIALDNLDAIIHLIRAAADSAAAKQELIDNYGLSEQQSDAILQMQLRRLTALEAQKIQQEHEELRTKIADLEDILARRERILEIAEVEAVEIKTKIATPRRSIIEHAEGEIDERDLIANEQAIILITEQGYIKRMPVSTFEAQSRATRGKAGAKMKEDDGVEHFLSCCDHDSVLFFSDRGVVYSVKAYQIPVCSRTARGTPVVQLLPIPIEEKITSMVSVTEFTSEEYLVMLTRGGYIKKTALSAFANIRTNGLIAISLEEGDQLRWVRRAKVGDSIIIGTRQGMAIHFRTNHEQLRPVGRATRGVKSMKLRSGDELISMDILPSSIIAEIAELVTGELEFEGAEVALLESGELEFEGAEIAELEAEDVELEEEELELQAEEIEGEDAEEIPAVSSEVPSVLVITSNGYGKRVPVSQFRLQRRAGKGLTATKFKSKKAKDYVAALRIVNDNDELMIITNRGIIIRQAVSAISTQSRTATGVRVQRLDEDDSIVAVALVPASGEESIEESASEEATEES
ncbi:DNA gyrase C-terminal beta-propeller domain-containing protein, partial [Microcoleus sp. herbarium8]|uniref:DNA gyrase C-terminal beta-propeller domain-containing protein n=1 Tax=Microcoleus sp. herbarium8 TaxID=3055436 RepID=UPI002FD013A4